MNTKFNIEKNGYSKNEVEDYLIKLNSEKNSEINELKEELNNLKADYNSLKQELKSYQDKTKSISDTLIVAVETAKEIENKNKHKYEFEIKKLNELYDKWENFLYSLIEKYPELKNEYDAKTILEKLKTSMNETLNLKQEEKPKNVIHRKSKPSKKTLEKDAMKQHFNSEQQRLSKSFKNLKPIMDINLDNEDEYENLVDKFLNNNENDNFLNEDEKNFPKPNKSGFDLKEAISPTEDLMDIMKSFNLD